MNLAYLLIGGNLGNRINNLNAAKKCIETEIGKVIEASSIYETAAWGNKKQPDFLNQILIVKTKLSAKEIMQKILSIENKMGRIRTQKNASRIIDIDILFFNNEIIDQPGVMIPHPEIQNRKFVLVPLAALSPNLIHPILKKIFCNYYLNAKINLQ